MKRLRGKLTYANVISTFCLFLLLGGGTAYAASRLEKGSVGTKQLKIGAVTPAKLSKASKAALTGSTGPIGPAGPQGKEGPQGLKGDNGEPGSARAWAFVNSNSTIKAGKGVIAVEHVYGVYCVFLEPGIDLTTAGAVVTPATVTAVDTYAFPGGCASPTHVKGIQVGFLEGHTSVEEPFTILVP
jgi:hypothetical protein